VLFTLALIVAGVMTARSQTSVNPATTTTEFGGQPNLTNAPADFTVPRGGIVLYGTAISSITGRPVRHLWVGDNTFGLCRTDPEIDAPGIHDINPNTCPFKLGGQSVTGGPLVFDPANSFLYLVDVRKSQGAYRLHYLADGDNGHGFLDFTSTFAIAGNPTAARFQGGQTGCPLPINSTLPTSPNFGSIDFAALGPDGNLWLASTNSGGILRINNPATASSVGFGTCDDFVQLVATTPDNAASNGIAWIGHDLWGADGTAPFVIRNADTTCQALGSTPTQTPTCTATAQLAAVGAVTTMVGDQQFPQLNGNNLYFATTAPGQVFWAGNVSGAQTLDLTFINTAQLPQPAAPAAPFPPLGTFGATAVDYTDPSNLAIYSGDDGSNTAALGAGRWWQTCLGTTATHCKTPAATAAPSTPTVIRAAAGNANVTLSWSDAQNNQPITSYTIHNNSVSSGNPIADVTVSASGSSPFPPTTVTIPVANGRSYAFQVRATNARGSSGFTSPSNSAAVPGATLPGIPMEVSASEGTRSAFVTWVAPSSGGAITSYTVTALALNPTTGAFALTNTSVTVAATATTAVVNNLTNGTTYEFSVHASNTGGKGLESTPSNPVTPTLLPPLALAMGGPTDLTTTPIQVTYPVTITNNTNQAFNTVNLTDTLTTTDGAFIILAQPTQGTCAAGGTGITSLACSLGSLAAGATAQVNVIVQIQGAGVKNTAVITAGGGRSATASQSTTAPPAGGTISAAVSITGNAQVPNPNVGQAGNIVWTISDVTQTRAPSVLFTTAVPAGLVLNTVAFAENNPTNGTLTCTYTENGRNPVACPAGVIGSARGGTIQVQADPGLGGSTAAGAKPPQTMTVTVNVTAPNASGTVFNSPGTVTFGPGGTDTLPNSANVTITVK
jgi:Fibronectin type III domain/Domain of unknown function DUF11